MLQLERFPPIGGKVARENPIVARHFRLAPSSHSSLAHHRNQSQTRKSSTAVCASPLRSRLLTTALYRRGWIPGSGVVPRSSVGPRLAHRQDLLRHRSPFPESAHRAWLHNERGSEIAGTP